MVTGKLDEELIANWVEPNPHKPGPADVRIRGHGVAVWAIIGQIALELDTELVWHGAGDIQGEACLNPSPRIIDAVAHYYRLPVGAVEAALAYYRRNPGPIVAFLTLNRADVDE